MWRTAEFSIETYAPSACRRFHPPVRPCCLDLSLAERDQVLSTSREDSALAVVKTVENHAGVGHIPGVFRLFVVHRPRCRPGVLRVLVVPGSLGVERTQDRNDPKIPGSRENDREDRGSLAI